LCFPHEAANRDFNIHRDEIARSCWLPLIIIIGVALFVLWRAPLALVVILAAWHQVLGAVLLLVILGVVALRGRMTGRPF
jgi:hypothetical protein